MGDQRLKKKVKDRKHKEKEDENQKKMVRERLKTDKTKNAED